MYQNGSTTMKRASGSSAVRRCRSASIACLDVVGRRRVAEVVVQAHGHEHDVGILRRSRATGRSVCGRRLFTKPRPLTLGLNSCQPRSRQMTLDQRFARIGGAGAERVRVAVERGERCVRVGHGASVGLGGAGRRRAQAASSRAAAASAAANGIRLMPSIRPRMPTQYWGIGALAISRTLGGCPTIAAAASSRSCSSAPPASPACCSSGYLPSRVDGGVEPAVRRVLAWLQGLGAPEWVNYDFADFVANIGFFVPIGLVAAAAAAVAGVVAGDPDRRGAVGAARARAVAVPARAVRELDGCRGQHGRGGDRRADRRRDPGRRSVERRCRRIECFQASARPAASPRPARRSAPR